MKNQIKLICVALIVILCTSLCVFTVSATPDSTEALTQAPQPVATEPITQATQPPTQAPTQAPVTDPPTEATQPPTQATTAPPTVATTAPTAAATTAPPAPVYTNPATYATQSPAVASTYSSNPAQNVDLYDTDGSDVDTDTLKDSDWEKIAKQLENADNKGGSGDDFNFIKNNENRGNNASWLFYIGIAFIVIGSLVMIAIIVYEVRKRKKQKKHRGNGRGNNQGENRGPEDRPSEPKRMSPAEKKQINRRSKFDTDEVYIPRRTSGGSRGRSSGGTRYKPRH